MKVVVVAVVSVVVVLVVDHTPSYCFHRTHDTDLHFHSFHMKHRANCLQNCPVMHPEQACLLENCHASLLDSYHTYHTDLVFHIVVVDTLVVHHKCMIPVVVAVVVAVVAVVDNMDF